MWLALAIVCLLTILIIMSQMGIAQQDEEWANELRKDTHNKKKDSGKQ